MGPYKLAVRQVAQAIYLQAFFFKIFGLNWSSYIIHGSSLNALITYFFFKTIIDLNFTGSTALSSTDSGLRVGRAGSTNAQLVFDHSETRWAIDNAAGSNINLVGVSTTDTITNKTNTLAATLESLSLYIDLNKRKVTEFEEDKLKIMDQFIDEHKKNFNSENLVLSDKLKK